LKARNSKIITNLNLPIIAYSVPQILIQKPQNSGEMFKKGFYIRPMFSPDISTIAGNKIGEIGSNWGIMLDYRFAKRLSIQTGVIRSLKLYDAYPEQYTFAWKVPYGTALKEIVATCKMIDIPINIRYDLTKKSNSRLFVSSGVTSYLMLNEKYEYIYTNPTAPGIKWRDWEGNTGNYFFGVANFSLGYERKIAKRWTIQAEPFVKIPLDKIGFGDVKLLSTGLFVSAKYPLIRR
jgi:hypothetical protein